ncbi:UNVERIFIED_CONTAM: hypothetical protein FKN15_048272 [Acipenser sinensis]
MVFDSEPIQCSSFGFHGCGSEEAVDSKLSVEEEAAKRVAEMGKPVLGQHSKLEVIIEESYEFKVRDPPSAPLLNASTQTGDVQWGFLEHYLY